MVFQDALTALNPVYTVGNQIAEAIKVHDDLPDDVVQARVLELLDTVGIPNPARRADQYPHEYSGGMRQRAMIAMTIANEPEVLIADEPTTALDVTIQAQVLEVLERIQDRTKSSIILITHDLGVVAGVADRVLVMYAGRAGRARERRRPLLQPAPSLRAWLAGVAAARRRPTRRAPQSHRRPAAVAHRDPDRAARSILDATTLALPSPCQTERPELREIDAGHLSACHFAEELPTLSTSELAADESGEASVG